MSYIPMQPPRRPSSGLAMLVRGLGWFSIGLGVLELLAPRKMARQSGLAEGQAPQVAAYGLREIGTGIGILAARDPGPWVMARVAGDAMDALTLARAARQPSGPGLPIALGLVLGIAAVDLACSLALRPSRRQPRLPTADYSGRSGWSGPVEAMRGAARDAPIPEDMRFPRPLRPYS